MIAAVPPHARRRNAEVAAPLDRLAALLEEQRANPFRVQAWRTAAATLRGLDEPVDVLLEREGAAGLDRLPGIGPTTAAAIEQVAHTGRLAMLERLSGERDPVALLASVPGIGPRLAARVHDALDIDTLEELELAAHDGRLATVDGFGAKRVQGIRDALGTRLGRRLRAAPAAVPPEEPPVGELLDIDQAYRDGDRAGTLPRIAPRRFNPTHEAWLPVLHAKRGDRAYTALYSNTARAHELGRTFDWVVLYVDGARGERRYTVVTAPAGPLRGRRVVRGREGECLAHYGEGGP